MSETTLERVLRLSGAGQVANPLDVAEVARALAAAEAREVALREALARAYVATSEHDGDHLSTCDFLLDASDMPRRCDCGWLEAAALLSAPRDSTALRGLLLSAANLGYQDGADHPSRSPAEVVDAVLRGSG